MQLRQPAVEFWLSTPKRVAAFFKAYQNLERLSDYRAGVIAAVIANQNRGKNGKPLQPADFFQTLKMPRRTMALDEMRAAVIKRFGLRLEA